jgi:hypothetical protein
MPKEPAAEVTAARKLLEVARDSLDQAVATLAGPEDDDAAMATPALLELLLNAVRAKRQLDSVELLLTAPTAGLGLVRVN